MAQLDRLLSLLVSNRGTRLLLVADDVAKLELGGVPRPVSKNPLSAQQVLVLLQEIAPPGALPDDHVNGGLDFGYRSTDGGFRARVTRANGLLTAEILPDEHVDAAAPAAHLGNGSANGNGAGGAMRSPTPAHVPSAGVARSAAQVAGGQALGESLARQEMEGLLRTLVERGGSDLHLRVGEPPILRCHGDMERLEMPALANGQLEAMLLSIMPDRTRDEYTQSSDADWAHEMDGLGRFRANALRERKGAAAVFRAIPSKIISVEDLGISPEVQRLCHLTKGLVLVTGPTGSGKSTTLCGLIDLVNRVRNDHVITIEDPIEFVHENKKCVITQRQVGVHTGSFKQALRAALREDPDIILVGELRDLETVSIAIETAETGHLVFGTLHTTTAASTIDRVIDQFPPDRQEQVRTMLAESLRGVISQTLCKKVGGGRVAAREVLLTIPAISNLIREGKTFQIPSIIQTSKRIGMVTLNDALGDLVDRELVDPREAYFKAVDKAGFLLMLRNRGHDTSFIEAETGRPDAAPAPSVAGRR